MELFIYHSKECDPKKCTALKLGKFDKAKIFYKNSRLPSGSILLDPFSNKALSYEDQKTAQRRGITAFDCSWNQIRKIHFKTRTTQNRSLPFLVAGNPTYFGHATKLSTVEALSAALYILREKKQAKDLLEGFKWGHTFLELNEKLLEEYSKANKSSEIVNIQEKFINEENH